MTSSVSFASVSGRRRSITNLSLSSCACRRLSPTQSCGEGQCTHALGEFRESEHDSFMAAIQNGHTTACRTLPQDEESHFLPQNTTRQRANIEHFNKCTTGKVASRASKCCFSFCHTIASSARTTLALQHVQTRC